MSILRSYLKLRSKFRSNIKFLYWRVFIPINKILNKKYIPSVPFFSVEISNVCNLKCVFCGYQKYEGKFNIVSQIEFQNRIDQVAKITDWNISLTPLTGDVFTDKGLFEKLNYIENHPGIKSFGLTTNFTLCSHDDISKLLKLKKIRNLKISIYGHDSESFKAITKSNTYKKLVSNLEYLKNNINDLKFDLDLAYRSYMNFNFKNEEFQSKILDLTYEIEKKSNFVKKSRHVHYTNWGGTVTPLDIGNLDIILKDARKSYKNGPCNRLYSFLISANNEVVLCACRDTHRYMTIGNLNNSSLKEIISLDNPEYKKWISDQEKNIFEGPCKACDMYEPIYAKQLHLVLNSLRRPFSR